VWKLAYADFLLRAGLVGRRAALLQYSFSPVDPGNSGRSDAAASGDLGLQGLVLATVCAQCHDAVTLPDQTRCANCHARAAKPSCSVCRLPIKGLATTCTSCSHTSHIRCLRVVLDETGHCPACTCMCLHENGVSGGFVTAPFASAPPTATTTYGFVPERSMSPRPYDAAMGAHETTPAPSGGFGFNMTSAMNALSSLQIGALNLTGVGHAGGPPLAPGGGPGLAIGPAVGLPGGPAPARPSSPSPSGLVFEGPHGPHAAHTHAHTPYGPSASPEQYRRQQSALELATGPVTPDEEPAREATPTTGPAPREGLLARSRLRALGTEGILGW
jgi:hypothetical protein